MLEILQGMPFKQRAAFINTWMQSLTDEEQQMLLRASSLIDVVQDYELQLARSVLPPDSSGALPVVHAGAHPATQETYVWLTLALCGVLATVGLLRLTDDTGGGGGGSDPEGSDSSGGSASLLPLRSASALSALALNTLLLGLVAKVIQLNEALAVAIAPLLSTQMSLIEIITHSDEEKVSQVCSQRSTASCRLPIEHSVRRMDTVSICAR